MSFEGCNYFRQRLILSTLSGKTVRIKKIRSKEDDPGLKGDFKMNNVIVWLYWKKKKSCRRIIPFSRCKCVYLLLDDRICIRLRIFNDFVWLILSFDYFSDFEASFIRLLDKLTNGSNIVVNETGKYKIQLSFCGFQPQMKTIGRLYRM